MRRRIALISEHASPLAELGGADAGGQNVYVAEVARHLAVMGHTVDVFTRRDSPGQPEVVNWDFGTRVIHVPAGPPEPVAKEDLLPYMPEFAEFMRAWFAREKPYHLMHANFWMSGLVGADLKGETGIPLVVTFHALGLVRRSNLGADDRFPPEREAIERRVMDAADAIIAECPQEQEDLIVLYRADPAKLTIVPCGFDSGEFWPITRAAARQRLGIPADERLVLHVGRVVKRKGVDNVIRALANLRGQRGLPAHLIVVGGDTALGTREELGRLEQLALDLGVRDSVDFVGPRSRPELKYFYSAANVFVTTPWYEPFGITPLESMACGTPVVGSNVGGVKFTVRDGETGYLVPPRDPGSLAERLDHFFSHPELAASFARAGIRRVNDLFTWSQVAESLAATYEEVLDTDRLARRHSSMELDAITAGFDSLAASLRRSRTLLGGPVIEAANILTACFTRHHKVLICGNGGSAADSQHFAAEFVGRFQDDDRRGLPALALTADTAVLTSWANDRSYESVFARQIQALGAPGDALVVLSTSGRSANVTAALVEARRRGMQSIALLGGDGGDAAALASVAIIVPSADTQRIQELHLLLIHTLTALVERRITESGGATRVAAPPRASSHGRRLKGVTVR